MKALYEAVVTSQGGRDGRVKSSDGIIDFPVSMPKELGGKGGSTNPEQLFAAGYAACFESALLHVGRLKKIALTGQSVTARVGIGHNAGGGFQLAVNMQVSLPSLDQATANALVEAAHQVCPYSNATRGNIEVNLEVTAQK